MTHSLKPGLLVLHGNRLELLLDAVFDWLARNPLDPLEEEVFLVQSNGAGEWLKMSLARAAGICAATRVELPGRFLWRTYRQMLGRQRVLAQSALEKDALTWRLMRLLPAHLDEPAFAPIAAFLAGGDADRRLQLARRLAELYDTYQLFRADWLSLWENGLPSMTGPDGRRTDVPPDQRWQPALWDAIVDELDDTERASTRPHVHRDFLRAVAEGRQPAEALPRRIVLFGASHVSVQGLEAIAALSSRLQVIVAVPNPCRFHWSDIVEGREALQASRQRHPARGDGPLSAVSMEAMHLHAHPLLASWGRQGRDFMRQLDAYDDAERARERFELPRIDLFDDGPGTTLLEQVQASIRDLVPLAEHADRAIDASDRSIVFHVAHGPQREVEILHDRLLSLFATGSQGLAPRDVIVMVPDIEVFAPAIRAVFGQHRRDDARFIPFDIADLRSRGSNPLIVAVEWLLRIDRQRIRLQDVRDLLDVPAIAARVGIEADALPGLFAWLAGAGVRWGLHADHRAQLGLAATGEQNSWSFGLRRMLLGYASGRAASFEGIEPFDEIGGLEAAGVGSLVELFDRLDAWWAVARGDATPTEWARRGRALLAALVAPTDAREKLTVAALQGALAAWLEACELARFDETVPLSVLREGWLAGIDGLDASRRFLTGGVTFCTLMPLRAVPFEVVCLLGMNDGDFPRQARRNDFDLMALTGQQRPGDRSRRDDDRYLMLEALLSARRVLYVSWCGRSARDNGRQPPSVLVSQLRDYLAAAWHAASGGDLLDERTAMHPLQPFSRRYFEAGGLTTWAREWRAAHVVGDAADPNDAANDAAIDAAVDAAVDAAPFDASDVPLTIARLARFLRNPVRQYFRAQLGVQLTDDDASIDDDESFGLDGLAMYQLRADLLADPEAAIRGENDGSVERRLQRVTASGRLPMFELGTRVVDAAAAIVRPMLDRWVAWGDAFPLVAARQPLRVDTGHLVVDDWLDGLRSDGRSSAWMTMTPSRVLDAKGKAIRIDRLVEVWVRMLVATVCGHRVHGFVIGCDATLAIRPLDDRAARDALTDLLAAWREGTTRPLPFAMKTAIAFIDDPRRASDVYDGSFSIARGEGGEFCLQRVYPDFETLNADRGMEHYAMRLFAPLSRWVSSHVAIVPAGVGFAIVDEEAVA